MRRDRSKSNDDMSRLPLDDRMRQNTALCFRNRAIVAAADDVNNAKAFPRFPTDSLSKGGGAETGLSIAPVLAALLLPSDPGLR